MKRIRKTADEQEAYSHWGRKYLAWLSRPGAVKKVKRSTHKRERRESQHWIEEQRDDS
jgi:hypothetical protein